MEAERDQHPPQPRYPVGPGRLVVPVVGQRPRQVKLDLLDDRVVLVPRPHLRQEPVVVPHAGLVDHLFVGDPRLDQGRPDPAAVAEGDAAAEEVLEVRVELAAVRDVLAEEERVPRRAPLCRLTFLLKQPRSNEKPNFNALLNTT